MARRRTTGERPMYTYQNYEGRYNIALLTHHHELFTRILRLGALRLFDASYPCRQDAEEARHTIEIMIGR
jgi:hypothetical protein